MYCFSDFDLIGETKGQLRHGKNFKIAIQSDLVFIQSDLVFIQSDLVFIQSDLVFIKNEHRILCDIKKWTYSE